MINFKFEKMNKKTIASNLAVSTAVIVGGCYLCHALGLSAQYYVAVGIASQMFDIEVK